MEIDEEMDQKIRKEAQKRVKELGYDEPTVKAVWLTYELRVFAIKILKKYGGRCGMEVL